MCTVHESQKNIYYFILSHPLKNYLILSHSVPLSLSESLNSHPLPKLSQSLKLSSSLSYSPLTVDRLIVPSYRSPIASSSHATDCLTIPCRRSPHLPKLPIASPSLSSLLTQLTDLPLLPTQLADVVLICDWRLLILFVIVDFVWHGLRKKIGDLVFVFFFFFFAVDCWWWWLWLWL